MLDTIEHRNLVAKAALWRDLARPAPRTFLRRNLNYILDRNEQELLRERSHATDALSSGEDTMIANEKRSAGWDFPTVDMLTDLLDGKKPVLSIVSIQLRRHSSSSSRRRVRLRERRPRRDPEDPEWLPPPEDDCAFACQVLATVNDTRNSGNRVQVDVRDGRIVKHDGGGSSSNFVFDIQLHTPITIELEKLFIVTELGSSSSGIRHWKHTETVKYGLELAIQCQDSNDTAQLLGELENRPAAAYLDSPANERVLKVYWPALPECPSTGELLQMKRGNGQKTGDLEYGAEILMGWARRQDSPLVRYNRTLPDQQDESTQLPTPSASDDIEKLHTQPTIRYLFQENYQVYRSVTYHTFSCIFCRQEPTHSCFERLHLHYLTHHDHFQIEIDEGSRKGDDSGRRTIWVSVDDNRSIAEKDFDWLAPRQPLDLAAHVRGDGRWTTANYSRGRVGGGGGKRGRQRRENDVAPPVIPVRTNRKLLAPEDVKDLPAPRRRQHEVPHVPGVRFYKTNSKQEVEPGTYVSDSDDDIDLFWLEQSQRRDLNEWGMDQVEQDFNKLFNRHLDREQPMSDTLVRDCIVRFARQNRDQLRDPSWREVFSDKLDQFQTRRVIGKDVVTYCLSQLSLSPEENGDATINGHATNARRPVPSTNGVDHLSAHEQFIPESPEPEDGSLRSRHQKETTPCGQSGTPNSNTTSPETASKRRIRWSAKDGRMDVQDERSLAEGRNASPLGSRASSRIRGDGHVNGVKGGGNNSPARSTDCVCGVPATSLRGTLVCGNPDCDRQFHLACVGLDVKQRSLDWLCMDCSP